MTLQMWSGEGEGEKTGTHTAGRGVCRSSQYRDSGTDLGAVTWDSTEHGPEDRPQLSFRPSAALKFHPASLPQLPGDPRRGRTMTVH